MNKYKLIGIISGICGLLTGIAMIIFGFADIAVPKPIWLLFAVDCLLNVVLIIVNFKKRIDLNSSGN